MTSMLLFLRRVPNGFWFPIKKKTSVRVLSPRDNVPEGKKKVPLGYVEPITVSSTKPKQKQALERLWKPSGLQKAMDTIDMGTLNTALNQTVFTGYLCTVCFTGVLRLGPASEIKEFLCDRCSTAYNGGYYEYDTNFLWKQS